MNSLRPQLGGGPRSLCSDLSDKGSETQRQRLESPAPWTQVTLGLDGVALGSGVTGVAEAG